jgi:uncharacterized damage-inducible protein DinB
MERVDPPYAADERTMLVAFLDYYRETMIAKLEGLTEEQARWKPAETANSLIGMVQHLAYVEQWWFRTCFAGEPDEPIPGSEEDPDIDFKVPEDRTIEDVAAFYRSQYARANEIVKAAPSLDDFSAVDARGKPKTLRWILVHMIEETARHAGHADITRELIDGSTGD